MPNTTPVNTNEADTSAVTARQVVATTFGDPADSLEVIKVELPLPGPGQVVVTTTAIGVNPIDGKIVRGQMGADQSTLPRRIGSEAAGVIHALGDQLEDTPFAVAVGDPVVVYPVSGAFADHLVVNATAVHPIPASLDPQLAAGLSVVGGTAADALTTAGIGPDDTLLVHGGSGAVGSMAIQLAARAGATVIATGSASNQEAIRDLGATPVVYGDGLLERIVALTPGTITAAIDTVGTDEAIDTSLALVSDSTRIVSIAAFSRAGDGITLIDGSTSESRRHRNEAIPSLIADAASGALRTEVAATYPLTQAAQALNDLAAHHPRGKFILIP